jgi:hypothetical protein
MPHIWGTDDTPDWVRDAMDDDEIGGTIDMNPDGYALGFADGQRVGLAYGAALATVAFVVLEVLHLLAAIR